MRPKFAIAIDRVFGQVLDLLARIERSEAGAPEDERARVQAAITRSENELGQGPEWEAAKYALVAWTDEMLIAASWEGCNFWNEKKLETEYFGTNDRAWRFFKEADRAASAEFKRRDALEVFYIAVVLGFRGIYSEGDPVKADRFVKQHGFRHRSIEEWLRHTSKSITLGIDRPRIDATPSNPGLDAAPREGEMMLLTWLGVGIVLMLVTVALVAFNMPKISDYFKL